MDKANEIPASPLDIFLLPGWVHKKISEKLPGLIAASFFVGLYDLFYYQNLIDAGFFGGDFKTLLLRVLLFIIFSLLMGAADIFVCMVPVGGLAIMIGNRSGQYTGGRIPVILMKSYALSHIFAFVPATIFIYSGIDWTNVNASSAGWLRVLFSALVVIITILPYIQLGVVYRTISVKTRIQIFGKFILIFAAYFWMKLTSGIIYYLEAAAQKILLNI